MISGGGRSSSGAGWLWKGTSSIKGSSEAMKMALLTASLIGVQITWGIEMTYCTPYLLRLGLTKSRVSLVWVAGPLSGLVMQPIIGVVADRSRSKWGRRRPYMVAGTILVILCMLLLGWTEEFVSLIAGKPITPQSQPKAAKKPSNPAQAGGDTSLRSLTVFLAVLSIYGVDFAINAVQASARSLIVDTLPASKQQVGSAWASRMVAVGHLVGYAVGAIDLRACFGTALGDTQFKQLIIIACMVLAASVAITCWAVTERVLISTGKDDENGSGEDDLSLVAMFKELFTTATNLPPRIATICWIQFWSWIGWFPFLFYITTWIGEVYLRFNASEQDREHPDSFGQMGRVGSTSLIIFSCITFACSMILPLCVESPEDANGVEKEEASPSFTPRPPKLIAKTLESLEGSLSRFKPSLLTAWTYSHAIFAGSMICAPFVTSLNWATFLVAMCGLPWALQSWAPFTFLGIEINALSAPSALPNSYDQTHKSRASTELSASEKSALRAEIVESAPEVNSTSFQPSTGAGDLSGVYLGILNLYVTLPQFIGTFISWIVFSILEPGKSPELAKEAHPVEHHSTEGPNAISVCLFIGAICAIRAAQISSKLK